MKYNSYLQMCKKFKKYILKKQRKRFTLLTVTCLVYINILRSRSSLSATLTVTKMKLFQLPAQLCAHTGFLLTASITMFLCSKLWFGAFSFTPLQFTALTKSFLIACLIICQSMFFTSTPPSNPSSSTTFYLVSRQD